MVGSFWQQFWELVGGALHLNPSIFVELESDSHHRWIAIAVIFLAGLSQAIGQSIVLFANRVKPLRFVLSLVTAALLFFVTYLFWVLSIWVVVDFVFQGTFKVERIATTLALCYASQLFAFLVALPYLGVAIAIGLSIWTLLATYVGLTATTTLASGQILAAVGLGWLGLQVGQRTVGRPLTRLAQWFRTTSAGKPLITNRQALTSLLNEGHQRSRPPSEIYWSEPLTQKTQAQVQRRLYQFVAIAFVSFLVTGFIATSYRGITLWFRALNHTTQLMLNLGLLSFLALGVAILLTPLESLSWWAGWQPETPLNPGVAVRPRDRDIAITRYVAYLDGINQGTYRYLPEVEQFLNQLATALPPDILVVKGIIPYSVSNRQLTEGNPFAMLWRMVATFQATLPQLPIGFIVNIRNLVAVTISADARYGPIQNQGLAQVLYDSLVYHGYQPGSGTPITLIGFSGGGQMSMGAVPYLQQATRSPIEVISLAGVISGNTGAMQTTRVYHLAGNRDFVQKMGSILFPGRWPVATQSNWNQAKRRDRIIAISLGNVGHNGPNGPLSLTARLPDGRSHLQQTLDIIIGILVSDWPRTGLDPTHLGQPGHAKPAPTLPLNPVNLAPLTRTQQGMKYSDLKGIFAEEQTNRGLRVIGIDRDGRQVEVLFQITTEPKSDWEAVNIRHL